MFDLKRFIKNGLLKAVGKMADYQVILNAVGWFDKGVLEESDLAELEAAIEEKAFNANENSNGISEEVKAEV